MFTLVQLKGGYKQKKYLKNMTKSLASSVNKKDNNILSETKDYITIANSIIAQLAVFEAFKVGAIAEIKQANVCIDSVKGYIRKNIII